MNVRWLPPLAVVLCGLLRIKRAWSRDHATSSMAAILPLPGQRCETVCLNSFGNRTSPSDNSNDRWKRSCLVSWAVAPCVWTLRALTINLLTYLLTVVDTGRSIGGIWLEAGAWRCVSSADLSTSACSTDWRWHSDPLLYVHRHW